ncbi:MAG: ABC transporter ATP-binding protein/permease [Lachnospiraceae bacterium]
MIKKRLVELLSHTKKYIAYNVLFQWMTLMAQIVVVFTIAGLLQRVLDNGFQYGSHTTATLILVTALGIRFVCDRLAAKASYQASVDVKQILRNKIYEKLLRLGTSYREKASTAEVIQMSAEGVEQLEVYFGKYLPQLCYSLLAPLTLFVVLSFVNLKASLILLICVPLIPLSIVAVQKIAKKLLDRYWGMYTGLGDSFLENLQGLTTLKIYQADEKKAQEMDEEAQNFRKITMKVLTMQLNSTSVMDIIAYGGAAVGMTVAIMEFSKGNLDFFGVFVILLLASEFFIPLRLLGSFFHIAMNGMAASDKIFGLLDLPEPQQGIAVLDRAEGMDISLKEVSFSYEKEREILHRVNMEIPNHALISIVGESGCGKSTIAGILTGKNKEYQGEISIGGLPLCEISEESLLKEITLVTHNSYLFKGTVEENLKMAKPDAKKEELEEVLRLVNLYDFLQSRQGLETKLEEKGANFSGGQCQRIALARALLHDTPMYIFDEATSNIDAGSEAVIMEVISELAKRKTVLLISHRLENVVGSDCIYYLAKGSVRECGTHKELMKKKGGYCKLYSTQKRLEEYGQRYESSYDRRKNA